MDGFFHPSSNQSQPSYWDNSSDAEDLYPLPQGWVDLTGDRGVLLHIKEQNSSGKQPSNTHTIVEMHFEGFLVADGYRFESTRNRLYTKTVAIRTVIDGLSIALRELHVGDIATVTIAPNYAYGEKGEGRIPPDAELRFEIEILDVRESCNRENSNAGAPMQLMEQDRELADLGGAEGSEMYYQGMKDKRDCTNNFNGKTSMRKTGGKKKGGGNGGHGGNGKKGRNKNKRKRRH